MSTGEVTPLHEAWRYKQFSSTNFGNQVFGAGAVNYCAIVVPYDHYLRRATLGATAIDQVGTTITAKVKRAISGAALAEVAAFTDLVDQAAVFIEDHVSEAAIFKDESGPAMYVLEIDGDNAGDDITDPVLSLLISPVPPGPA